MHHNEMNGKQCLFKNLKHYSIQYEMFSKLYQISNIWTKINMYSLIYKKIKGLLSKIM